MLKAATIKSNEVLSRRLGRQLGQALMQELGQAPKACWLFTAPSSGIADLLQGLGESLSGSSLVGCSSDGEISEAGLSSNSVVLGGLATDRIDFEVVTTHGLGQDSEGAGRRLAEAFSKSPNYIQIFSDGLTGNGCAILKGLTAVLGEHIPIAGGTAGDNGKFLKTLQFAGDQVYTDALCGIAFYGDFRLGTGVRSGWSPIGLAKRVTRSRGNVLYELNGEPALNVYERFLGRHAEKLPVIGVEYPLGLVEPCGEAGQEEYHLIRATMAVNREERSITFAGEVTEGALVHLTCGDVSSILEAAGQAAGLAKAALNGAAPSLAFCYSCMARKIVLGRRTEEEIKRVRSEIGTSVPIIGFYTYGEYCRISTGGPNYFHNETITLSLLGMK
ncbi:MAG: FIST C-terminal domain-containing protein [Deltaproteobacteria bacterium]|nr:FIST C-terminal domain-containing protein [Deltaproteobacteria bacterium]